MMRHAKQVWVRRGEGWIVPALVLASGTLSVPAAAYRTASDLPEFRGVDQVRWLDPAVPYELHGPLPTDLSPDATMQAIVDGCSAWAAPACSAVAPWSRGLSDVGASDEGTVGFSWAADWSARGFSAEVIGTTDLTYRRGADGQWHIADAHVLFNSEHATWAAEVAGPRGDERDVQAVAAHECGHALGMAHSCSWDGADGAPGCRDDSRFAQTVMFPDYVGVTQRELAADDEAGICFLYAASDCDVAGCADGQECTPDGCRERCDSATCVVGGAAGDPCEVASECDSRHCSQAGFCASLCRPEGRCAEGYRCDETAVVPECLPEAGVFGEACERPSECTAGFCLAGATAGPVCTRSCGDHLPGCPPRHSCGLVGASQVCVPAQGDARDGCAASGAPQSGAPAVLLTLVALLGVRRSRRTRIHR